MIYSIRNTVLTCFSYHLIVWREKPSCHQMLSTFRKYALPAAPQRTLHSMPSTGNLQLQAGRRSHRNTQTLFCHGTRSKKVFIGRYLTFASILRCHLFCWAAPLVRPLCMQQFFSLQFFSLHPHFESLHCQHTQFHSELSRQRKCCCQGRSVQACQGRGCF